MGNKLVLIVIAVLVIAGIVVGLGVSGIVPIPGLTHAKKKSKSAKSDKDADAAKAADPSTAAKADPAKPAADAKQTDPKSNTQVADAPKPDLEKGYAKLAAVWAEMEPAKIEAVIKSDYKPDAAAPILKRMDEDKVAAILSDMEAKDAAAYGDALAKEASKPPPTPPIS